MRWLPQYISKHRRRLCRIKRKTRRRHCYRRGQWRSGNVRQVVQICVIMSLHDFLTTWMLTCHAHITLTCHLLAAHLLCVAHPGIRNQTVRTRYSKEQQEYGRSYDLVNELHSVSIIDVLLLGFCGQDKSYMLLAQKLVAPRWPRQREHRWSLTPTRTRTSERAEP